MEDILVHGVTLGAGRSCVTAGISTSLCDLGIDVLPMQPISFTDQVFRVSGGEICETKANETILVGRKPVIDTNPVLVKGPSYRIMVRGREFTQHGSSSFHRSWKELADESLRTFPMMKDSADLVVCESYGNPSDFRLRATEFSNLLFERVKPRVFLVGDIDRCGVFAGLLGTIELLPESHRRRISGIIINKFRGDPSILQPAFDEIEDRTGIPTLGIVPFVEDLPARQSLAKAEKLAKTVREEIGNPVMDALKL
jgi:adenosylcobyric acid synthase